MASSKAQADVDVWVALAAPLSRSDIEWRADGKPTANGTCRFVPYTNAQAVLRRLDSVAKGEWDVTITELPILRLEEKQRDGTVTSRQVVPVKSRITVLAVAREDIGQGEDYKGAASDAFKRAAVRFGIGAELYGIGTVWVKVGTGNYPAPLEDPYDAWQRSLQPGAQRPASVVRADAATPAPRPLPASFTAPDDGALLDPDPTPTVRLEGVLHPDDAACPTCAGSMYDNREGKRNPKAPNFKCKDKGCEGVIWPPRGGASDPYLPTGSTRAAVPSGVPQELVEGLDLDEDGDPLPF